jgi:hypothetical protein
MTEAPAPAEIVFRFTPDEVALIRVALRILRATLGREEADELAEVQALLKRLDSAI